VKTLIEQDIDGDRLLTSHEVGALLQVNPSSVNKWVKEGRIVAFRTPGGHRRIRARDLVEFLDNHKMPIPRRLNSASKRRLLVCDDDDAQLRAIERLLKSKLDRIQVQYVANGVDALVAVGSFRPHMIVLDVYMPELDGIEVCRRLKSNPDTQHIDVVIASAQLTPEIEGKAVSAGASRCIKKPIDMAALLSHLGISSKHA
jgi:excisionase family DNA binding protein